MQMQQQQQQVQAQAAVEAKAHDDSARAAFAEQAKRVVQLEREARVLIFPRPTKPVGEVLIAVGQPL